MSRADDPDTLVGQTGDVGLDVAAKPPRREGADDDAHAYEDDEHERSEEPTGSAGVYAFGEVIGRGGMGEVILAHDKRIGRDVAVKRLRSAEPSEDDVARFLREARIQ